MAIDAAVGIDLGATQIKGVVVSRSGEVMRREMRPTDDDPGEVPAFLETVRTLVAELGQELPVGLSAPGLASPDRRCIAHLPVRLRGIEALDWTEFLRSRYFVPVNNDGHASLLGEAWIGAGRGLANVIMLTLGTGVGGAIMADGRLLRGQIGRAGHFGHISLDLHGPPSIVGTPGALECLIGNYNLRERSGGRFATTPALLAAAQNGDAYAAEIWQRSIRALACALSSLINVLDPEAVILGGGIAQAGSVLFEPLAAELAQIEWRPGGHAVKLLPALLGEWSGAIGAAREALGELVH